jgi:hypothetical protein
MPASVDPQILALAEKVIAEGKNKRAIAVLKVFLDKGTISTDELQSMGYNHPPRAVGDVRDTGIPIVTSSITSSKSGRRMAVYAFGDPAQIQSGRIGGRSAFPKAFKTELIAHYGSRDCITGAQLDDRVLQIDHRIPYRISGDAGLEDHSVTDYMLLDASSQRAKSWSCENCPNMTVKSPAVCQTCYWAFPEDYKHIATQEIRRTDIAWQGSDVAVHDKLKAIASANDEEVAELLRRIARQIAKTS